MSATDDEVRVVIKVIRDVAMKAINGLQHAPYRVAHGPIDELENLPETVAAELGSGFIGWWCESCEEPILDERGAMGEDGNHFCADCVAEMQEP